MNKKIILEKDTSDEKTKDEKTKDHETKDKEKIERYAMWFVIVLVILIILGILGTVFATKAYITDFADRLVNFNKPSEYYRIVEEKQIEKNAQLFSKLYDSYYCDLIMSEADYNASLNIETVLNEKGREKMTEVSSALNKDLSWTENFRLTGNQNVKNQNFSQEWEAILDNKSILGMEVITNSEENEIYYKIPQLSDRYIGIEESGCEARLCFGTIDEKLTEWLMVSDVKKQMERCSKECADKTVMKEALPSKEEVEQIFTRYMQLGLRSVSDVEKVGKENISVDGVSKKATRFDVTIGREEAIEIYQTIYESLIEDKELKEIIIHMEEARDVSADGYVEYNKLVDEWNKKIENASSEVDVKQDLVISVYVDGKGDIIGRKVVKDGETGMEYMSVRHKKDVSFLFADYRDNKKNVLTVKGTVSFGKLSGTYVLEHNDSAFFKGEIQSLNINRITKGKLDCKLTAQLSPGAVEVLSEHDRDDLYPVLGETVANIALKADYSEATLNVLFKEENEKMGSLSAQYQLRKGKNKDIPSVKKVTIIKDTEELDRWMDEVKWKKYIEKLKKANAAEEWIDWMEKAVEERDD